MELQPWETQDSRSGLRELTSKKLWETHITASCRVSQLLKFNRLNQTTKINLCCRMNWEITIGSHIYFNLKLIQESRKLTWWTSIAMKHLLKLERKSSIGLYKELLLWLIGPPNKASNQESSPKRPPLVTSRPKLKLQCLWPTTRSGRTLMRITSPTRHLCFPSLISKSTCSRMK